jgi:mitogen-activated protein kinase kinase
MAAPIRKKRNFKLLQLDVAEASAPAEHEPVPTRLPPVPAAAAAGAAGGKKRPPPMTLKTPKMSGANGDADKVSTPNGLNSALPTASASSRRNTYHDTLSNTLANLDVNAETKRFDLRNDDLKDLQELGQGNGGSVKKVEHIPTGTMMAKKVSLHPLHSRLC